MFTNNISRLFRRLGLKLRYQIPFYIKFLVVLFVSVFLFDKIVLENRYHRRKIHIHNDLRKYNEDGLRPHWPFQTNKHYDVNDLRSYNSKAKFNSGLDSPGEAGDDNITSKK